MATKSLLRRAFSSSGQISLLLRSSSVKSYHHFSSSPAIPSIHIDSSITHSFPQISPIDSLLLFRRGFAKKRNAQSNLPLSLCVSLCAFLTDYLFFWLIVCLFVGIDDNYDEGSFESVDIGASVKTTTVSQMEAAIDALSRELSKLRTGRASIGILFYCLCCFCSFSFYFIACLDVLFPLLIF